MESPLKRTADVFSRIYPTFHRQRGISIPRVPPRSDRLLEVGAAARDFNPSRPASRGQRYPRVYTPRDGALILPVLYESAGNNRL